MPGRPCRQAAWLWTAVASFVAGTVWWCAHDDRTAGGTPGWTRRTGDADVRLEMHMYEPDPEQAAMVAVAVWALLASRHFRRTGVSAVAGVPAGLAVVARFGRATCTRSWLPGRSSPTSG
jgi:hypothetical protein